ncbi:phosphotransferase [Clavibacter capsici]|uniref:phosphotransferase n=1 Tax=Clavibacter capsici TaxID=1874630 RepID=UPI00293F1BB1|nr:phosphotransferase [Clavibacter capsici]
MDGPLDGGNMNRVEREGDTVTRDAGPWTPTVHRWLRHLALAGVDGIPQPLGIEGGRERLTYLHGDVPVYPLPRWIWADDVLVQAGRRLRELHDASVGFALDGAVWQSPAKVPAEVICHNDFAPHNLVFADGRLTGVIDMDMCSPGPRIWDIAYLATRAVPLTGSTPEGAPAMDDARRRVALLLDAYGSDATWADVLRVAILRLHDLAAMSIAKADELGKPHLRDEAALYEADAACLRGILEVERAHPDRA